MKALFFLIVCLCVWQASLSSKVAQRMMMGLFAGNSNQRIEFVRMKGPQGKGHAEMAVTKPKGEEMEHSFCYTPSCNKHLKDLERTAQRLVK